MLRVRSTRNCPNTPRVLFALEEAGMAYETALAEDGWFTGAYGIPGPALEVDGAGPVTEESRAPGSSESIEEGFIVVELGAILRHIGRAYGAGTLMPSGLQGQAHVDRWLDFQHRRVGRAQQARDVELLRALLGRLDAQLVGRQYVLGDFTIADCGLAALVLTRDKLPALDGLADLAGYLDRLAARPAWTRALERTLR